MDDAYDLIVVGASWGGLHAVSRLLEQLPEDLTAPLAVAQHRSATSRPGGLEELLQDHTSWPVCEGRDKLPIERRHVYVAPPDYHLLVEEDGFALSVDERVRHARPSIDVLFESAADVYGERLIAVVLTGANDDGADGVRAVKARGGTTVAQDPGEAERFEMPAAAIATGAIDRVLPLARIGPAVAELCGAVV